MQKNNPIQMSVVCGTVLQKFISYYNTMNYGLSVANDDAVLINVECLRCRVDQS